MNLKDYGYKPFFEHAFKEEENENLLPGRIIEEHGKYYQVVCEVGIIQTEIKGKIKDSLHLAVGDWVLLEKLPNENKGIIHEVLPRKTKFSRKVAGFEAIEQIVASNFDYVFIVQSLNQDFNVRRIERYLVLAWESGAIPIIILSKADLCLDINEKVSQVEKIAFGVEIHAISSVTGYGFEMIKKYFEKGKTIALLGSSGVGKSSLVNYLAGKEVLKVNEIRTQDDKGRHTTTHRQLVLLPNGCMVVDTPGMRELQLWDGEDGINETFRDIEELAKQCRFNDCTHKGEPGCAVLEAIDNGDLENSRLDHYKKLQREAQYVQRRANQRVRIQEKQRGKKLAKFTRQRNKEIW